MDLSEPCPRRKLKKWADWGFINASISKYGGINDWKKL